MNISSHLPAFLRHKSGTRPECRDDLGAGFPSVPAAPTSIAHKIQDWVSGRDVLGLYGKGVDRLLDEVSGPAEDAVGINFHGLLDVERRLYKDLASGSEGYKGDGHPAPLFEALANGQASYVSLGPERQSDADHLMLLFNGMSAEQLAKVTFENPELGKIRDLLLQKAANNEFPVFVDTDNSFDSKTATESIATGSLLSIAKRENGFGDDFSDPQAYYKWLLTRVNSNYAKLDPWLFASKPELHRAVNSVKADLTPPWLATAKSKDPFGFEPRASDAQRAYRAMMEIAGGGDAPDWRVLTDVADSVVALDRDLMTGVQTYWIKLLSEVSPEQRKTLLAPVARSWVNLNVLGPEHAKFEEVSPPSSPMIELASRSGKESLERYDRALALSQAVDHAVNGLGLGERRQFIDGLMAEIGTKKKALLAREARLREELGEEYRGIDVEALIDGKADIRTPGVKEALADLVRASKPELGSHQMTESYAEICRHRDLLDWVATRHARYGDLAFDWVAEDPKSADFEENPLILSEYYSGDGAGNVSPITRIEPTGELFGTRAPGHQAMNASVVLEGGGGKGFAFVDVLKNLQETLSKGEGEVRIDEFVGNSAGALSAGMLAAGYKPEELGDILAELDFTKFYSDYLWLSGGVDPKVRGIGRTGLFTTQKMYQAMSELLKKKIPVEGRPVLFSDLPFKLKVTSTMLNGDIPPELREKLQLAPDGQVVFSSDTTPNMDVAAALSCSAAIPGFFHSPQLQVCSGSKDGKPVLHRLQMMDGGVVNNFPVAVATHDQDTFMMMLPASYQAPSPTKGGKPISLSTLDFDSTAVKQVDAYNRELYDGFAPHLKDALQAIGDKGYNRVVLGLNLGEIGSQSVPVVQGGDRAQTQELIATSASRGLPVMKAEQGARLVKSNFRSKSPSKAQRLLVDRLVDKDDVFSPGGKPTFRPSTAEAGGIPDMLAGAVAAAMSAPGQLNHKLFEHPGSVR